MSLFSKKIWIEYIFIKCLKLIVLWYIYRNILLTYNFDKWLNCFLSKIMYYWGGSVFSFTSSIYVILFRILPENQNFNMKNNLPPKGKNNKLPKLRKGKVLKKSFSGLLDYSLLNYLSQALFK